MSRIKWHCVTWKQKDPGVVVTEHLRYAGVVSVNGMGHTGFAVGDAPTRLGPLGENEVYLTVKADAREVTGVWAEHLVQRLASFGIRAIAWSRNW